jgi:ribonuclease P protein component
MTTSLNSVFGANKWVSPHIVPATSAVSVHTGSVLVWKHAGVVKYLADVVKKDASVSQSSCQVSTQARKQLGFPRARRVVLNSELDAIKTSGKKIRTKHLEIRTLGTSSPTLEPSGYTPSVSRAAIIVPKYDHTVVQRNRLRRRLRELVRVKILPYTASIDIFIRPLPGAYKLSFAELAEDMDRVMDKL